MQELQWQVLKRRTHSRHGSVYSRDKCAKNHAYLFLENVVVCSRNTLCNLLQWLYYMVDIYKYSWLMVMVYISKRVKNSWDNTLCFGLERSPLQMAITA